MLSEKIALIDDDIKIHKSIKMAFPEYEITGFFNGEEALNYLNRPNEINLVLLDVMLPQRDGISILGEIKKLKKNMGVILMTAYGSKEIIIDALRN